MYKIKCSNGKYVTKTCDGTWISYSKFGKVYNSLNIATKNLYLCQDFVENSKDEKYNKLTFELISYE